MASGPRIGVALGSGGARGLAHISYIEALSEMGVEPAVIAGSSIGALIGSGWANGMTGKDLREHALQSLGTLQEIAGRLWMTNRPTLKGIMSEGLSIQVDARNLTDAFLPEGFPEGFEALSTPFKVVATDYYTWETVVFEAGPLRPAIAASLAIPGLLRPVRFNERLLIDGGAADPLPVDLLRGTCDFVIAIDVNGQPEADPEAPEPNPVDVGLVATQIMTASIISKALALHPPDVYLHVPLKGIRVLEFWRVREVLEQTDLGKDEFKRSVAARLDAVAGAWDERSQRQSR